MKIGTMIFNIYGELIFKKSIEYFITSMDQILLTVSDKFDSDYRRFAFWAARINFVIPLKIFWKNDTIYKTLLKNLNKYFDNWTLDITLTIQEKGE